MASKLNINLPVSGNQNLLGDEVEQGFVPVEHGTADEKLDLWVWFGVHMSCLVDGSCAYAGVVPQAAVIVVIDDEDSRYGVDWRQRDRYQKIASKVEKEYGWREP